MKWKLLTLAVIGALGVSPAFAEKNYAPGVSDTEIKIGQTYAYSGPASALSTIPKAELAYFKMINEQGGVNGRKINLLSVDDALSPPKTLEQTRRLVEQDQVAFMFNSLGTATNLTVREYLNDKKVPQLFVGSGAAGFSDPKNYPWTMSMQYSYQTEARIYMKYILANLPNAKVAILAGSDDSGKDYMAGVKATLTPEQYKKLIVSEQTYETSDPNVDSQVIAMHESGADALVVFAITKWASQTIRKVFDIGWKPQIFLASIATSVTSVLQPAGLDKSTGIITAYYLKDPNDPQWANDPAFKEWLAFMKKYYPEGSLGDQLNVYAYAHAEALVQLLKQCGDDLSRENIVKQATNMNFSPSMFLPGIRVVTTPTDYVATKSLQMQRFNGKTWELFGPVVSGN